MEHYDGNIVNILDINTDRQQISNNNNIWIRTYLSIPLKGVNNGMEISVVMMNPSDADASISDKTVNKVIDFFSLQNQKKETKVGMIHILNLFPICSPRPKEAYQKIREIHQDDQLTSLMKENQKQLEGKFERCEYVVLAWGLPGESTIPYIFHHERALRVIGYLTRKKICMKSFEISDTESILRKTGDPRHPAGTRNQHLIGLYTIGHEDLYGLGTTIIH
ncbi:DUF1643 domain-containing protein [Bacillus pacificus]|uniref:DUF1643 domain-containing protein n=1 Tax=Bacillus pacificus TaxID=2026187 RepID=UPI003D64C0BC